MVELNQKNGPVLEQGKSLDDPEKQRAKRIFIIVSVVGVAALILGFTKLVQNLKTPFNPDISLSSTTILTNEQLQDVNNLKNKDTDSDSLTDYEELYLYNTSPYLKDSDSDGFKDNEEIASGNDPNCPSGANCSGAAASNTNQGTANGNANSSLLTGNVTAQTLRETLKNAGAPAYIIDSASDAELLEIYNQTVAETNNANANKNANANTNAAVNANVNASLFSNLNLSLNTNATTNEIYDTLSSLSSDDIRQLLVDNGVSESDLQNIDDGTLKAIFLKAIEEEINTSS